MQVLQSPRRISPVRRGARSIGSRSPPHLVLNTLLEHVENELRVGGRRAAVLRASEGLLRRRNTIARVVARSACADRSAHYSRAIAW